MPTNITTYHVFIGCPGGLELLRKEFVECLSDYNQREAIPRGALFLPVAWEETLPGRGRPQSLINDDLRQCDYGVFLFKDRWGSPPDESGVFTSGSEEEWTLANDLCSEGAMRGLALFFLPIAKSQLKDPGPQLKRLLEFKQKIERERRHLFKSLKKDTPAAFAQELTKLLSHWLRQHEHGESEDEAELRERAIQVRKLISHAAASIRYICAALQGGGPFFIALGAFERELREYLLSRKPGDVASSRSEISRLCTLAWREPGAAELARSISEGAQHLSLAEGDWQILSISLRLLAGIAADAYSAYMLSQSLWLEVGDTEMSKGAEEISKVVESKGLSEVVASVKSNMALYFITRYSDATNALADLVTLFAESCIDLSDAQLVRHTHALPSPSSRTHTDEILALLGRFRGEISDSNLDRLEKLATDLGVFTTKEHAVVKLREFQQSRNHQDADNNQDPDEDRELKRQMFELLYSLGVKDPDVSLFVGVFRDDPELVKASLESGARPDVGDGLVLSRHKAILAVEAPDLYAKHWLRQDGR
jgi:hypothetical protein